LDFIRTWTSAIDFVMAA